MSLRMQLASELEPYFRSGNDVPVERATIPAELAWRVIAALRGTDATDQTVLEHLKKHDNLRAIGVATGLSPTTLYASRNRLLAAGKIIQVSSDRGNKPARYRLA